MISFHHPRTPLARVSGLDELMRARQQLIGIRTFVLDIENSVAPYRCPPRVLATVLDRVRRDISGLPGIHHILFLSNAGNALPRLRPGSGPPVLIVPRAHKPFSILTPAVQHEIRAPAVVFGDQPLTDGLLAWSLRAPFVYRAISPPGEALWPRFLRWLGELTLPLFFEEQALSSILGTEIINRSQRQR